MSIQAIRFRAETLRSVAFGDISSSFTAVGDAFENTIRQIHITNLTDVEVFWSLDGIVSHGIIAAGGFILLDVTANKTNPDGWFIAKGEKIYINAVDTPTEKGVYLSAFYGSVL